MNDDLRAALEHAAAHPAWGFEDGHRRRRPPFSLVHAGFLAFRLARRRWHCFPDPLARGA